MTPLVTAAIKLLLSGISKGGGGGGGGSGKPELSAWEKSNEYHKKAMADGGGYADVLKNRKTPQVSRTGQNFLKRFGPNVG
jgi:hypothetical protein